MLYFCSSRIIAHDVKAFKKQTKCDQTSAFWCPLTYSHSECIRKPFLSSDWYDQTTSNLDHINTLTLGVAKTNEKNLHCRALDFHLPAFVIMMVADALMLDRYQAISKHPLLKNYIYTYKKVEKPIDYLYQLSWHAQICDIIKWWLFMSGQHVFWHDLYYELIDPL